MIRACGCSSRPNLTDGSIDLEICGQHRGDLEEFLAEREVFKGLLEAGVSRQLANEMMIKRIEARRTWG